MLTGLIDQYLLDRQSVKNQEYKDRHKDGPPNFYPSSVGRCPRYITYVMLGFLEVKFPAQIIRVMNNGNHVHSRIQETLDNMGIVIASELPLNKDSDDIRVADICRRYRISGRLDNIIRLDGCDYIVEIKSAKDRYFKQWKKANEPDPKHYKQIQLYMYITGIKQGIILVENKNDQELLEFRVEYDQECINEIMKVIQYINSHVDECIVPERAYAKTSFECRFCDANVMCWSS